MKEQTIFELIHSMDQFTNKLLIQWNKIFKENLGISHILLLGHLNRHGKSRPSDIAKTLGLTPPSVTHLSEKLVKRNLAVRQVDEKDRRIVYLAITQGGIDIVDKAHDEGRILRENLLEKLTEDEVTQLLVLYEKLNKVGHRDIP
ncbi:MarR family winged helix-turn-helix transcriptional regulator [Oceanobacillus sp. FSL H7-0719]|uniref:MarR family winged helix-turn-helix transcriptional regulator n=1 Tax=Oceanobacillus sp. FSL H7-0719 TaxID=2954507 RepID=UPI00325419C1